ncbi:MAG: hypothetical protein KAI16_01850 [Candidatus Pacebacteria bacterium]|nr:hypothetical protein [Candidatus Paceibacterota bacterium]
MNILTKRLLISSMLGLLFGFLCFFGLTQSPETPTAFTAWSYSNPMFWMVILNRVILGAFVGISGFMTLHPMFKFRICPIFRGMKVGVTVSLLLAVGVFLSPESEGTWKAFWLILGAGAFYGAVIDIITTKYSGEGESLIVRK